MKMLPDTFYPTPAELAERMIKMIENPHFVTVLEPSAGKGDLINALRNYEKSLSYTRWHREYEIECVEYDTVLNSFLQQQYANDRNVRIVGDDFLSYHPYKRYDVILMNPPFDDGDRHLLHAIQIQENGGEIVCLLNAETIRNPYSNSRKELVTKIKQLGGTVQYIKGAFEHAERPTDVEVCIVHINIPNKADSSFIYENLMAARKREQEKAEEEGRYEVSTAQNRVEALVEQYEQEAQLGISLIKEYDAVKPYIMAHDEENCSYNECLIRLKVGDNEDCTVNGYMTRLRRKFWHKLFNVPEFTSLLTSNLSSNLETLIQSMEEYEFSMYNIQRAFDNLKEQFLQGVNDTILKLFDKLTAEHSWYPECANNIHYFNGWATNKAHKIGMKVILPINGYDTHFVTYRGSYKDVKDDHIKAYKVLQTLRDIEQTFNYLDMGRTATIDLSKVIEAAENQYTTKNIECKYFFVSFYKKGTCHIVFKDEKLIEKLNIYAGINKNWLPPCYGKKQYRDMTAEEKAVIDDFQGEVAYTEVIQQQAFYLGKPDLLMLGQGE